MRTPSKSLPCDRRSAAPELPIEEFLSACCDFGQRYKVRKADLHQAFLEYCTEIGKPVPSHVNCMPQIGKALRLAGVKLPRMGKKKSYHGLRLKDEKSIPDPIEEPEAFNLRLFCPDEEPNSYKPSQQEIETACREMRSDWSEAEHRRRSSQRKRPVEILRIHDLPTRKDEDN